MNDLPTRAGLRLHAVSVSYRGAPALDAASFTAPRGEITALVGPSGCGKSSLLSAVNGLHALDPAAKVTGRVELLGGDASAFPPDTLRRRVGLIFQRPVPFPMSILENIRFPLRAHGIARSELDGRAEHALRKAALWDEVRDRLSASADTLSGGQQQRLCLARALALEPEVLLLDEPCAALDPRATAQVEDSLRALVPETTLLLVTHNLGQARRLASWTVALWPGPRGGRVVDEGPTARVFDLPATDALRDYVCGRVG